MKRKTKWRIGVLGAVVLILIVGGIAVKRIFLDTPTLQPMISVSTKDIPEEWLEDTSAETLEQEQGGRIDSVEPDTIREEQVEGRPTSLAEEEVTTGRLVFDAQGKQLGEERYVLTKTALGEITLTSEGTFYPPFKIPFITLKFSYNQQINLDSDLRPISFKLDMKGPLGFGSQKIEMQIEGDTAFISAGDERREESIDADNTVILGMFSSYALIPELFEARADGDKAIFEVLASGGFGGEGFGGEDGWERKETSTGAPPPSSGISSMEVERIGTTTIKAGSKEIEVERYLIKTGSGESILLVKDGELIGFIAQGPNGSFFVYRADFFPTGFEMISDDKEQESFRNQLMPSIT